MKTAKVTVEFVDANGNQVRKSFDVKYEPTITETICELEHVANTSTGGPTMRPKNPRY